MKYAYMVKAIVPWDGISAGYLHCEKLTIIAPNATEACQMAIAKAKRRTGYHGNRWRITELQEHAEPL